MNLKIKVYISTHFNFNLNNLKQKSFKISLKYNCYLFRKNNNNNNKYKKQQQLKVIFSLKIQISFLLFFKNKSIEIVLNFNIYF
jgi:hypothetical protein